MTHLSINLNKIALIRNSRTTSFPDPCEFAKLSIEAGAQGITVHPRPDQRHIRAQDCINIAESISVEFNIEGNPFSQSKDCHRGEISPYPGFMPLIERIKPEQVTLVPDSDDQLTSNQGFNILRDGDRLLPVIENLRGWGIRVSIFMDPDPRQIELIPQLGAQRIELYTERYAYAHRRGEYLSVLSEFIEAAEAAKEAGLGLNAGHDLNLTNLPDFKINGLLEVSIGHAFIIDSLRFGIKEATTQYLRALATRSN